MTRPACGGWARAVIGEAAQCNRLGGWAEFYIAGTEFALEHSQGGGLRAPGRLAHLLHVGDMRADPIADGVDTGDAGRRRGLAAIDLSLRLGRPPPGVIAPKKGFGGVPALPPDLGAPGPRFAPRERGHCRVRSVCTQPSKSGEKPRVLA